MALITGYSIPALYIATGTKKMKNRKDGKRWEKIEICKNGKYKKYGYKLNWFDNFFYLN